MTTVQKRWDDIEPAPQAHFDGQDIKEKEDAMAYSHDVDVYAANDDRDPALIPTDEDLRTLPRVPAGMP